MSVAKFEEQIIANKGNFQDNTISLEIKTKEGVAELINVFSNEQLRIGHLSINVDDSIADYFVEQLVTINPKPQIKILSLDKINLSHQSWDNLFKTLKTFPTISDLTLRDSNFDYTLDLDALGTYLASNPNMKSINLHHDKKIDDKTYYSGPVAEKLLAYLSTNTNLVDIAYAYPFGTISKENFSNDLQEKFLTNAGNIGYPALVRSKVRKLQNDGFALEIYKKLGTLAKKWVSIEAKFLNNTRSENDDFDVRLERNRFSHELSLFRDDFETAKQDERFRSSGKAGNLEKVLQFFIAQNNLLISLGKLKAQGDKASTHDYPILLCLHDDILRSWKSVVELQDPAERNQRTADMLREFQERCKKDLGKVKDSTSGALIKNVLLMISAVLTCFISLGIYALVTKKSRADSGNFFFKNVEASKDSIQEVAKDLENFDTRFKNPPSTW